MKEHNYCENDQDDNYQCRGGTVKIIFSSTLFFRFYLIVMTSTHYGFGIQFNVWAVVVGLITTTKPAFNSQRSVKNEGK